MTSVSGDNVVGVELRGKIYECCLQSGFGCFALSHSAAFCERRLYDSMMRSSL